MMEDLKRILVSVMMNKHCLRSGSYGVASEEI